MTPVMTGVVGLCSLLVLLVLVFAAQRLRPPKAAGQVYRKGGT